jgi:hypothetical protein
MHSLNQRSTISHKTLYKLSKQYLQLRHWLVTCQKAKEYRQLSQSVINTNVASAIAAAHQTE